MGDLVMYFASKMGVDTKFDCFLTGYAILNIPLFGRVVGYLLTCRQLSVDLSPATSWPAAGFQLTCRWLQLTCRWLPIWIRFSNRLENWWLLCKTSFPTKWKTVRLRGLRVNSYIIANYYPDENWMNALKKVKWITKVTLFFAIYHC